MATSYVSISREEFEEFLDSEVTPLVRHKWQRKGSTAGVYFFPLSKHTFLEISSSIGSSDDALGRGDAAIHVRLKSADGRRTLNGRGTDETKMRVNRTTNWRRNLQAMVKQYIATYQKSPRFYDTISSYEGFDNYLNTFKDLVQGVPNWNANKFLRDMMSLLEGKRLLTEAQEAAIIKASQAGSKSSERDTYQSDFEMWKSTIQGLPDWERSKFLTSLFNDLNQGKMIGPRAQDIVKEIVAKNKWLVKLREVWKRAKTLDEKQLVEEIGTSLKRIPKKNLPTDAEVQALIERFPGAFDDLLHPGTTKTRLAQVIARVASSYMMR